MNVKGCCPQKKPIPRLIKMTYTVLMIHNQTKRYIWEGSEHEHVEKTTDWYWGLIVVIITGVIIAIISKNYLLAILLVLGGTMLGMYANDKPAPVTVEISERGIKLNRDLYLYETVESFWMYQDPRGVNQLLLVTGRKILPQRIVTIPETIPVLELHNFLLQRIEEKETKPTLLNTVAQSFGL